jgi:hypothetical protein
LRRAVLTAHPGGADRGGMTDLPSRYEVVVRGHLSSRFAPLVDGVTVEARPGQTLLRIERSDDAALNRLLDRIHDLGLELVSVNAVA